nr:hypothetical protein [Nakamurella leprariae]
MFATHAAAPDHLRDVLAAGNARANEIADDTLSTVRDVLGMRY